MFKFGDKGKAPERIGVKLPTSEEITPTTEDVVEHKSDFHKSADVLEEARAGRQISDIPLDDPYWYISNAHTMAHGTHAIRVDSLPEQKRIDELTKKGIIVEKVAK